MKNWSNKEYILDNNLLLTNEIIKDFITKFWNEVVESELINNDKHLLLMFRIKFENNQMTTLGQLKKINLEDKEYFIEYIQDILALKTDHYKEIPINSIFFSYGVRDGLAPSKTNENKELKFQTWYNNKLPIAWKPEDYGTVLTHKGNLWIVAINNKITVHINQILRKKNSINLIKYFKNNKLVYEWKDILTNPTVPNSFNREIGKSVYHFKNGELVLVNRGTPTWGRR